MKVYDRLAEGFVAEGATSTFGLMGACNAWWMHCMHQRGVKLYDVRYEGAGLFMADGWARATNQVGVATATDGPGTAQMSAALITASRALSPVVAFVGEPATTFPDDAQQLDHARFAAACEAGFVRLTAPQLADEVVRKAFYLARTESRPVLLSCPIETSARRYKALGRAHVLRLYVRNFWSETIHHRPKDVVHHDVRL